MQHFVALNDADRLTLRRERVRLLEAELYRAMLQEEEALSEDERAAMRRDVDGLSSRLSVHYAALGVSNPLDIGEDVEPVADEGVSDAK